MVSGEILSRGPNEISELAVNKKELSCFPHFGTTEYF